MPSNATKKIRIIMSFGRRGDTGELLSDPKEIRISERRAALFYTAVKGILEKHRRPELDIARCIKHFGEITPSVFDDIATADVVVAILDRLNPTVVFELAFRYTLRAQIILVVTDQKAIEEAIPFYLKDWAFVQCSDEFHKTLLGEAEDFIQFPELTFENCELSGGLKKLMGVEDGWGRELCEALDDALASEPTPSKYFQNVVPESFELEPWGRVSNYPLSILRVDFHKMSDIETGHYAQSDMAGLPVVFDANRGFAKIFNIWFKENETIYSQLQRKDPLDFSRLMDHLNGTGGGQRLTHKDWDEKEFEADQQRLTELVIFFDAEASSNLLIPHPPERDLYAKVPICLADDHPEEEMRGECFLPCLIAKRHSGDFPNGQHSAYFEIAYINVTHLAGIIAPLKGAPMGLAPG